MKIIKIITCFIIVVDNKLILAAMVLTYNNNTIELFTRSVKKGVVDVMMRYSFPACVVE